MKRKKDVIDLRVIVGTITFQVINIIFDGNNSFSTYHIYPIRISVRSSIDVPLSIFPRNLCIFFFFWPNSTNLTCILPIDWSNRGMKKKTASEIPNLDYSTNNTLGIIHFVSIFFLVKNEIYKFDSVLHHKIFIYNYRFSLYTNNGILV